MDRDDSSRDTEKTDRLDVIFQELVMLGEVLQAMEHRINLLEAKIHQVEVSIELLHNALRAHAQRLEDLERKMRRRDIIDAH